MDSFFKAAVCDLDKLLDDFELNTEDVDCKPAVPSERPPPPPYPGASQCFVPAQPTVVSNSLPDVNALHYCPASTSTSTSSNGSKNQRAQEKPLTGVDLLSSVNGRANNNNNTTNSKSLTAPPCPDRALKPVCDLVSDASSAAAAAAAVAASNNSHDAFRELEEAERQLEEELLVDFSSPVVSLPSEAGGAQANSVGAQSGSDPANSLSLLDVILPAGVDRLGDPQESLLPNSSPETLAFNGAEVLHSHTLPDGTSCSTTEEQSITPANGEPVAPSANHVAQNGKEVGSVSEDLKPSAAATTDDCDAAAAAPSAVQPLGESVAGEEPENCAAASEPPAPDPEASSMSCLPMAVSMCSSLVSSREEKEAVAAAASSDVEARKAQERTESSSLSAPSSSTGAESQQPPVQPPAQEMASSAAPPPKECETSVENHASLEACPEAGCPKSVSDEASSSSSTPAHIVRSPATGEEAPPRPPGGRLSPYEEMSSRSLPESSQSPPSDDGYGYQSELGFANDYLPESERAEAEAAMVTDEELDAFLKAQASCHADASNDDKDDGFSEMNGDAMDVDALMEGELRSCPAPAADSFASPESDQSFACVAEDRDVSEPSTPSQDSVPGTPPRDVSPAAGRVPNATCNSTPPQHLYFGGARPKTLGPGLRSPPARPCHDGNLHETPSPADFGENNIHTPPPNVEAPQTPSPQREGVPPPDPPTPYPSEDRFESSLEYDELSEPPPYPGRTVGEGVPAGAPNQAGTSADDGLGSKQPSWVPDSEAPTCMNCGQKFTFTKRRHHCRACGKVYCAVCCSRKCRLKYLDKEARVCVVCYDTIQRGFPREEKHVWFADGILPNGEVADTTRLSVRPRRPSQESSPVTPDPPSTPNSKPLPPPKEAEAEVEQKEEEETGGGGGGVGGGGETPSAAVVERRAPTGPWDYTLLSGLTACVSRDPCLVPDDPEGLPPLLIATGDDDAGDLLVEERPATCQILLLLEEGGPRPLTFVLNANLVVNVKLVTYGERRCWCVSSSGLRGVGQRELLFVLECLPEESSLPRDLFTLISSIYLDAQRGKFIEDLGNVTFTDSFLGTKDHGGVLFFLPSFQPMEGLAAPPEPFLCGVLLQKLEVPWAKVFPLRLLLRLGLEHNVYPCTLVSVRFRQPVFQETGHTIMNLLADLRNYQYSLPQVEGLRVHMEMGNSTIHIPKARFHEMLKVVNSSNEHVISVGACFSTEADSHLVCVQSEEGGYQTKANSMLGKTRRVTGASFVVFNGALKASSGFIAKSSIVEDGLMVQIPPDSMGALRQALRDQADFQIPCGRADSSEARENVTIRWVDWSPPVNRGVTSPIDGRSLEGVSSVRIQQETVFESDGRTIVCTEVFYLLKSSECPLGAVMSSCSQFQREMATAGCAALCPHLAVLMAAGINSLGLRISTDTDMVEYQAGSGGRPLPQRYMNELDGALIPAIHGGSSRVPQHALDMELVFYISHSL
ncbi:zinc finger FYVE domain-containing protein 16 isoform X2 [Engraulis encrasicolus]|uniref:zinc finger FYVE domain-containing protein 16 isoform X2 n=1 Tax=Engraulis encrasicolus TaxID=184585 RepID=UPI002FD201EE